MERDSHTIKYSNHYDDIDLRVNVYKQFVLHQFHASFAVEKYVHVLRKDLVRTVSWLTTFLQFTVQYNICDSSRYYKQLDKVHDK